MAIPEIAISILAGLGLDAILRNNDKTFIRSCTIYVILYVLADFAAIAVLSFSNFKLRTFVRAPLFALLWSMAVPVVLYRFHKIGDAADGGCRQLPLAELSLH